VGAAFPALMTEELIVRTIGLFAEIGPSRPEVYRESIYDAVRPDAEPEEEDICEYLNSGIPLFDVMESTRDVISGDSYIKGGPSLLTDGTWVWREDLQYYVKRYHVALPEEFIRHARESGFRVGVHDRDHLISLGFEAAEVVLNMTVRRSQ
jgi:hypothetical protein